MARIKALRASSLVGPPLGPHFSLEPGLERLLATIVVTPAEALTPIALFTIQAIPCTPELPMGAVAVPITTIGTKV